MAAAVNANGLYAIGCVCLLVVAAALRFYNLSDAALRYDEMAVALVSREPLSDVVRYTRYTHHIPILYPLALWAVQKTAVSAELGARLMPAIASLLTVGALLFLMPRVGVARRAAFLAALLAALSVAAIEHAQDAREYSVDALIAALMIAGALRYLRDGGKALLCGALLVGPLLQYGLALFGVAVIGAAALAPVASAQTAAGGGRRGYAAAVWERVRRRIDLLLPIGAFAAGCGLSWELTAQYQLSDIDRPSYPAFADFYYQGGYDAAAVAEFVVSRTWQLLSYHMPPLMAGAALAAFGALLLSSLMRRRLEAVALVALLAVGIAICAALTGAYPLGGIRHNLYLGPAVFLAAGSAFHSVADDVGALLRRRWVSPALGAAAAVAIAVVCANAVRQYQGYLYYSDPGVKRALVALEELAQEGDVVYVSRWEVTAAEFYMREKPSNYIYGEAVCWSGDWAECAPEMVDEMFRGAGDSRRIWLVHNASVSAQEEVASYTQEAAVEEIDVGGRAASNAPQADSLPAPHYDRQVDRRLRQRGHNSWPRPRATLHLITGFEGLAANIREERLAMYDAVVSKTPSAVADYNLYLQDDALYYAKRPCAAADTVAPFFLHIYPSDAAALPAYRRQYGFENLDFEFQGHGLRVDDKCVIRRALPEYTIERIHAGQFVLDGDVVWEAELAFNP